MENTLIWNVVFLHRGGIVFVAWFTPLFALKFLFRKELGVNPETPGFSKRETIKEPRTWHAAITVLGIVVVLFFFHYALGWDSWTVAATGLTLLLFFANPVHPH